MARNFTRASSQGLHNATALVTAEPFTVSMWAKTTDISLTNQVLFSAIDNTANGRGFYFQILNSPANGTVRVRHDSDSGTGSAVSSNQMSNNTWHHVAAVYSASNSRSVFLDGVKVTNTTSAGAISVFETNIGYFNVTFGDYLDGDIACIGIWALALADAEVAQLAAGASPRHVCTSGLINYWPIIHGGSSEIDIAGGNDSTPNNFSLTGSPTVSANPRMYW